MKRKDRNTFIEQAIQVHGTKYDYSKVEYVNATTKVCIICPIHGEFWQLPNNHLKQECPHCANLKRGKSSNTLDFIEKARKIHGDKYDYSKVEYVLNNKEICIICPIHGEFWQKPQVHLLGSGCKKCSHKSDRYDLEELIEKLNEIHNNKYDYSKLEYTSVKNKVKIICPIHGEFEQKLDNHIQGKGCPLCSSSKLEVEIEKLLEEKDIYFEREKRFEWLGLQSLDFYIPKYNIAIECQGIQHFESIGFFGGDDGFEKIKEMDKMKFEKCLSNKIRLLYFSNLKIDYPYKVITDKEELLCEVYGR